MLKRTIVISSPCKLSLKNSQLIIESSTGTVSTVPAEDLSNVIIENQQAIITIPAINELVSRNVAVTICDAKMMPASIIQPLDGNSIQAERYQIQLDASVPIKKLIWKQIIESKIRNQSRLLDRLSKDGDILKPFYSNVKSGDSDNREGIAARIYWRELFGEDFFRDRNGPYPNCLLNYGYTILRAATCRAIVGAGLLPAFGIHHHNRYNAFPLADDLMEPFRPMVDEIVYTLVSEGRLTLDKDVKNRLINVLYVDTLVDNLKHPLSISLSMMCTSMIEVMKGKIKKMKLPVVI